MTVQAIVNLKTAKKRGAEQKQPSNFKFDVISRSSEKFFGMTIGALKFRDSMKFNDAGLAKMIESQREVKTKLSECFPILAKEHPFVQN